MPPAGRTVTCFISAAVPLNFFLLLGPTPQAIISVFFLWTVIWCPKLYFRFRPQNTRKTLNTLANVTSS